MGALTIHDYEYYIVFQDSKGNYIYGYGYNSMPRMVDFQYVFSEIFNVPELKIAIPDFANVIGYATVTVMKHKKFMKYMEEQEAKMSRLEKGGGK